VSGREAVAEDAAAILDRAAARGIEDGVPYAGLVTPTEAWNLHRAGAAAIVDVRTRPEYEYVGRVPDSILVEWRRYDESRPNPGFLDELAARFGRDATLLFLCRSAVRSHHAAAAAAAAGFGLAFNVLEGFEGERDSRGQRGALGGWRSARLPWIQD
jgi:rhodanese-related sulfurtransferase